MKNGKLVLTRKLHQPLYFQFIDQDGNLQEINVMLSDISGKQARVVIDAPKSVSIRRGEAMFL